MPNWCSNSIVVTGKKGIIDLILTKINLIHSGKRPMTLMRKTRKSLPKRSQEL